ncbi:MAG: extracellular solute-binding protein [Ignavibacteria bacterium]|nr:extracellular solute-binding protein [Ignavibacteria bacterium]
MNKVSKFIVESPIWFISILIPILSIIFYLYHPIQLSLFPEQEIKKIYYIDNISEAHRILIERFNQRYKNKIEVVPVNLPFYNFTTNDRKEILTRSLRSHSDGIDVFAVDLIWIPRFAKWGYAIDEYFDKSLLNNIDKTILETSYQNNNIVALPLFLDIGVLYYRKDIINQLNDGAEIEKKLKQSITWKEFIELGKRFKGKNNPYYVFCGSDFEGMACTFFDLLSPAEMNNIFYGKNINLDNYSVKRSLNLMSDFINKYKYSPLNVLKFDETRSYFYTNANDAVFLRGWIGYHKQYKRQLPDTSKLKYLEIAPMPHFEGEKTASVFGGWNLMISKTSSRKEESVKFLKFMFEKESQEILYETGGMLPVNNEVYSDTNFTKKHPELLRIKEILKWGKHRPSLENYTKISEIITHFFHLALKNEISVDDAILVATEKINKEKTLND